MSTLRVAVIYGGRGRGHELSCQSANTVIRHLNRDRYDVLPVHITPDGHWGTGAADRSPLESMTQALDAMASVDVAFPCLHGEDGTIQSVLSFSGIPYVGSGVVASAATTNGEIARKLLAADGIPVAGTLASSGDSIRVGVLEYPDGRLTTTAGLDNIPAEMADRLGGFAVRAFRALGCAGLLQIGFRSDSRVEHTSSRVEHADSRVEAVIDDVDTMPNLALDAPFARAWQATGMAYPLLLDLLIETAVGHGRPVPDAVAERSLP
ncbi:hypothetical protein [Actinoplanes derwentensis]|uniref:D-alanine--D-alanine ligase n=1 Tax=Actinoplanes derwentensis TaxID=113562 RepID=A0A1H2CHV5_9ACTN|nr:hypothetical protein [Actinoplanes derwentensis]GID88711.1 hypothetical protein Ade03nite_76350 [Actinoplanes derwentensis]SDT70078.1 D-alanine--D-alanine ligase [Actinoplanes derwentensis]